MSKLKSKSANHELRLSRLSYAESHTHVALEVSKPRQNIPMFLPITLWPLAFGLFGLSSPIFITFKMTHIEAKTINICEI